MDHYYIPHRALSPRDREDSEFRVYEQTPAGLEKALKKLNRQYPIVRYMRKNERRQYLSR